MQKLQITHNADYSEYIAENGNERTVMYVRKYSTVIVKERGSEMLECASFGEGPMQKFREMYLKEHPLTAKEIMEKMK